MPLPSLATASTVLVLFLLQSILGPGAGVFSEVLRAGSTGILLFIWWKTFKSARQDADEEREASRKLHRQSVEETRRQSEIRHEEHIQARQETRQLLKEINDTQQRLAGTVLRVETKLDNHTDN
jgi:hypothetical protein